MQYLFFEVFSKCVNMADIYALFFRVDLDPNLKKLFKMRTLFLSVVTYIICQSWGQ